MNKLVLGLIIMSCICVTEQVSAATLEMKSKYTSVEVGDLVELTASLDTEGVTINALEGVFEIPQSFEFVAIQDTKSFIQLWVEKPEYVEGSIRFSGIVPGGFSGVINPSHGKTESGTLFSVLVKPRKIGEHSLRLSIDSLLTRDGKPVSSPVIPLETIFTVTEGNTHTATVQNVDDTIPPEEFSLAFAEMMVSGDTVPFVAFSTQDKGSGMYFYTVQEGNGAVQTTESPYFLKNKDTSLVTVRAYDKAGNMREASGYPVASSTTHNSQIVLLWSVSISTLCILLYIFLRKRV